MNPKFLLVAVLVFGAADSVFSQVDRPWWRQLFRQRGGELELSVPDPVDPIQTGEAPDGTEELLSMPDSGLGESESELGVPKGSVEWSIPWRIQALSPKNPTAKNVRISGHRVQVFLGDLDSARVLRQSLMADRQMGWRVYVQPYPPMFGVTLGNFVDRLAAHRAMLALRERFPNALVVTAKMPLNEVYPAQANRAQAPELASPNRD